MPRLRLLALAALLALPGWSPGQPVYPKPWPPEGIPPLAGRWYFEGNRNLPCSIEEVAGPHDSLLLTNADGAVTRGFVYGRNRIVADSWGGLQGRIHWNVIRWDNGTYWTR